jgi:hypothetical protein
MQEGVMTGCWGYNTYMTIYVFGNPDLDFDSAAITAANYLKNTIPGIEFKFTPPNADINFDTHHPVILDVVMGIKKIIVFKNLDQLIPPPHASVHDFDLGFQLKYLKKLGQITSTTIIGLPMSKTPDYFRIQSILRKLVEQDIHGS